MKQAQIFTTGQGSRERGQVKTCPDCGSDDLRYNQNEMTRDIVKCGRCGIRFSKRSRGEKSINRW